jgi:hypothetical protein
MHRFLETSRNLQHSGHSAAKLSDPFLQSKWSLYSSIDAEAGATLPFSEKKVITSL